MQGIDPLPGSPPFLHNLLLFPRLLRRAGVPVSLDQSLRFVDGLRWVDLRQRKQVYHAARCLLLSKREDLPIFDHLFGLFWRAPGTPPPRGQKTPLAPRHEEKRKKPFNIVTYMAYKAKQADQELDVQDRSGTYSATEILRHKDFSALEAEELASVEKLIREIRWRLAERRTRRRRPQTRGEAVDLRAALRLAARHGGSLPLLPRRSRRLRQRPLVVLADISGSMEKYSRLVLLFTYAMAQSAAGVESFVFGTRLSRITPQLRHRSVDRAIDEAARDVLDWAGGTRIGESLEAFNRHWSRRVLGRGAVVLLISDGWERGDSSLLAREIADLQRRCHRLIWLNPLLGDSRYRPVVEGMSAALPFVDDFLPIHNLSSLDQLSRVLRNLPARRTGPGAAHRSKISVGDGRSSVETQGTPAAVVSPAESPVEGERKH